MRSGVLTGTDTRWRIARTNGLWTPQSAANEYYIIIICSAFTLGDLKLNGPEDVGIRITHREHFRLKDV